MDRHCVANGWADPIASPLMLRASRRVFAETAHSPLNALVERAAAFKSAHSKGVRGPCPASNALHRRAHKSDLTRNRARTLAFTSVNFKPQRLHRCPALTFIQGKFTNCTAPVCIKVARRASFVPGAVRRANREYARVERDRRA